MTTTPATIATAAATSMSATTPPSAMPAAPLAPRQRIVIDTNVCLDLFVFRDPRWAALLQALQDGSVHAVTRADCRMEWQLVLDYTHLKIDEALKPAIKLQFDQLIECIEPPTAMNMIRLPQCTDRDDQKFLELALQAGADMLITKDKALLKLAKKTARAGLFAILPPQSWTPPAGG